MIINLQMVTFLFGAHFISWPIKKQTYVTRLMIEVKDVAYRTTPTETIRKHFIENLKLNEFIRLVKLSCHNKVTISSIKMASKVLKGNPLMLTGLMK